MRNILALAIFATLAACNAQESGDAENNIAAAPTDVDVLPPDESIATPSDDLAQGAIDPSNAGGAENAQEAGAAAENSQ